VTGDNNVGGLIGNNDGGTVSSSFWDTETSGQTTSGGGTGKTTAEMKTLSTFSSADWDFCGPGIWNIGNGKNNGYPYLRWEYPADPPPVVLPSGDGISGSPYQIATLCNLYWITQNSSKWNSFYIQTADIDASLTTAWDYSPIGNNTTKFTGSYDGDGHTIDELNISGSADYCGFFGYTDGAKISNLGVNVNISAGNYVGGLVGYNYYSTVTECYSSGSATGDNNVGGLVGYNSSNCIVHECYSTCSATGDNNVGGLVGLNHSSTVTECYSTGSVTGTSHVGGLVGWSLFGTVGSSFWDTETSGQPTSAGGTGKTTDSMKTQSIFLNAGWSPSIWYMDAGADFNDGYPYLHWQNPGGTPLPVELFSFAASVNKNDVTLNWTTAWEINNAGFEVERQSLSSGKDIWAKIGFVEGYGTSNEPKNYTFVDRKLKTGKYNYRLKQIDYNNRNVEHFLSDIVTIGVPKKYAISQNYPNPFNPTTKIDFEIPNDSKVSIIIFDILGRKITSLVNGFIEAGYHTIEFDGSNFASGMYFYRIHAEGFEKVKKMILLK